MPLPTSNDVHVDALLTNVSVGYKNASYVADQIFPLVPVRKQSDIIPEYSQSFWFRNEAKLRAPGTRAAEGGYAVVTTNTYFCPRFSFAKSIDDETRDNADSPFNLERDAVAYVTDKLQLKRELSFVTDFFTTSVWGTDKTGGTDFTVWSNFAGSDPILDITTYRDTVEAAIGREPNVGVMGKQVLLQLRNHPSILDSIKYTQRAGLASEGLIQELFELNKLLVGRAIYTTTKEGTAEASVSYSRVWGKHMLLIYVPSGPSLMEPAAGYTFVWQRVPNAIQYIQRFRRDEEEADVIVANSYFDQKKVVANAGLFLSGAVS